MYRGHDVTGTIVQFFVVLWAIATSIVVVLNCFNVVGIITVYGVMFGAFEVALIVMVVCFVIDEYIADKEWKKRKEEMEED